MKVQDFTTTNFVQLSSQSTIRETLASFLNQKLDIGCVTANGKLVGIVTKYSVYRLLLQNPSLDTPLHDIIKKEVITIQKNESLYTAKDMLLENNIGHAVVLNEDQTVYGVMAKSNLIKGFIADIAKSKRLEKILDSALELAYDGVLITDNEGYITTANHGFIQLYGYETIEEVVGKPIYAIAPEIPFKKSLEEDLEVDGEVVEINKKKCVIAQRPIYRDQQKLGAIFKIIFRQINLWKDLFQHMEQLEHEITFYRGELLRITHTNDTFAHLISCSSTMDQLKKDALIAARSFSTILIIGESGTGKGLLAEGIHNRSERSGAFVKVNCAAIPEELLESEFFGYVEGAFTGARKGGKPGKFELADQGTLFLDEIGDMPLSLQAKLLRVLQEQEFERIGDTKTTSVNVRIIAATNKDLERLVREKKFREDLYYRIHVIRLHIPPLRQRMEDIEPLCDHFVRKINTKTSKSILGITPEVIRLLKTHQWPGNVRQLENVLERAFHFSNTGWIETAHLPSELFRTPDDQIEENISADRDLNRLEMINDTERTAILRALAKVNGNRTKAAGILGLSRSALYQKLKKYNIKEVSNFHIS
jgi:transcriptional regulator with PAS, ATPase and Fis domain